MKILFLDLETSPNIVWSWGVHRKTPLSHNNILKERQIICACWKWAGERKVHSIHWGLKEQNDYEVVKKLGEVVREADLIVGHNSDKFDLGWLRGRTLYHGLPPLSEGSTEDTYKLARKTLYLNSYRLDYLGQFLKVGRKRKTQDGLWHRVQFEKNGKALKQMVMYCAQDVKLTERVYNRISPHVPHPVNKTLLRYAHKWGCPSCGASIMQSTRDGVRATKAQLKQRRRCGKCHSVYQTPLVGGK